MILYPPQDYKKCSSPIGLSYSIITLYLFYLVPLPSQQETTTSISAPDICNILRKLMTTFHIFVPGWLLLYPVTVPGRRCAMAPSPSQVECTEATGTKDRQYARCYRTRVAATDGSFAKVECTEAPKYTKTKI